MLPLPPLLPLVLVFGYISITALGETSAPLPLAAILHLKREKGRGGGWGDLAKAGGPEAARHPRKVSDRIRSFISEGERGAMEPAVTVGRKSGETTQTLNLRGDRMSRPDLQSSARRPVMVYYIRSCRGGAGHCGAVLSCSALLSFSGVTSLFLLLPPLLMVQHMTCI